MALHDLSPKRLNYEDYVLIPDDGKRHEILDGEHYVTAAPFVRHQRLVVRLTILIGGFVETHDLGQLLVAPTDVVLSPHDVVQPDLLFISNARASIVGEKNVQGAPDLVIEILSESTRRLDEAVKLEAYERFGALEYWMLDSRRKGADVWERGPGGLRRKPFLSAAAGDILTTPLLPGLEIPLAAILRD
jgi:Uma2 family endonuclease